MLTWVTFQSTLRELEKKIELETAEYEELMLELTLTKKHERTTQVGQHSPFYLTSTIPSFNPCLKLSIMNHRCVQSIMIHRYVQ